MDTSTAQLFECVAPEAAGAPELGQAEQISMSSMASIAAIWPKALRAMAYLQPCLQLCDALINAMCAARYVFQGLHTAVDEPHG